MVRAEYPKFMFVFGGALGFLLGIIVSFIGS